MFQKIVVPVDLAHEAVLQKTLTVAAEMARLYQAAICFVGVASASPGPVARTPEDYANKLRAFAEAQAATHGVTTEAHAIQSHDPAVDMNKALDRAVTELGADLVVMQSHVPNVADYIWAGHGAHVAAHSKASVFLVRD